ncbi:YqzE family protein [Halobacillus amylolyticus]|uniref:YqzE family protein n=1 Tax=Halobacillus amylolyticus TaxID=2932259 RepID=A0ABY4HD26_9BACI|nr:YqzE family protein [Halobacillus amylolyticus]UOR12327.1 YqzE family protein [Halobacillus amylolyticus]
MKKNEYVQFLTEETLKYMHMSKQEKLDRRVERPSKRSSSYWFGILPFALKIMKRKWQKHS